MNFLIPTQIRDTHALAVANVLSQRGHNVIRWFPADIPSRQWVTFCFNNESSSNYKIYGVDIDISNLEFDVVWLRRPSLPALAEILHPADRCMAEEECETFYKSIWSVIAPNATWINPFQSQSSGENKLLQLKTARQCGFSIPDCIISNNPYEICKFLEKHSKAGAIYKTFRQHRWDLPDGGQSKLFTSKVSIEDLPDNDILEMTPGIYQEAIKKNYEVRANFFDNYNISASIVYKNDYDDGILDWRSASTDKRKVKKIVLPNDIARKCIIFMKKLNLRFGCFDFIVDEFDNYRFLEVNPMGQFLWIEMECPDIPLLSIFTQFLEAAPTRKPFFPNEDNIKFEDVYKNDKFNMKIHMEESMHMFRYKFSAIDADSK